MNDCCIAGEDSTSGPNDAHVDSDGGVVTAEGWIGHPGGGVVFAEPSGGLTSTSLEELLFAAEYSCCKIMRCLSPAAICTCAGDMVAGTRGSRCCSRRTGEGADRGDKVVVTAAVACVCRLVNGGVDGR